MEKQNDYISITTKRAGLIGFPVGHSVSPAMQKAAYKAMGFDAIYMPFETPPQKLEAVIEAMKTMGFMGCNVTIPHKQAVLHMMDELDESAAICGAVNTILFNNGKMKGFNTDGLGFVRAMKEKAGFDPKGKRCLVIGAGGAARGVTAALAMSGTSFFNILNREEEFYMAEQLSSDINEKHPCISCANVLARDMVADALKDSDFVLNTTCVGMAPNIDGVPFDTELLERRHAVFDVIYTPRETRLLSEAKGKGCKTLSGFWMLIYQGVESIRIWTGKDAPVDVMAKAAESCLTQQEKIML